MTFVWKIWNRKVNSFVHTWRARSNEILRNARLLDLFGNGNRKYDKYLKIHLTTSYSWNNITFQIEKNSKSS